MILMNGSQAAAVGQLQMFETVSKRLEQAHIVVPIEFNTCERNRRNLFPCVEVPLSRCGGRAGENLGVTVGRDQSPKRSPEV